MFPAMLGQERALTSLDALYQREIFDMDSILAQAASYHFNTPGKSFRAQLALSSGEALGLNEYDNLHWAAACELLHNASLIHDDISDASTHRRGKESIHEHFGSDMALCLGDWMVAKAFELATRNKQYGGALAALLARAMQDTCRGQISDISQRQCIELDEWQNIVKGKTTPLLLAPIKGAALAAGLSQHSDSLEPLGTLETLVGLCGLAYQGLNDIEDIIPSSHHSCDMEGRKPNLVVSLFFKQGIGKVEFNTWYQAEDNSHLFHWQRRIACSDIVLKAYQTVDFWLLQAAEQISDLPTELQPVAYSLVESVKPKTTINIEGWIA
jgi:geranylgeranyl pyrophosphate synthase